MVRLRFVIATALIALVSAVLPASAAPKPGIHGGGFLRASDGSKVTLTVSAADDLAGDKGQAQLVRRMRTGKANPVHITLHCVNVVGSTGIASGFGADGRMYLVVVNDNGEGQDAPDAFAVVEMLGAPIYCLGGIVPSDVKLGFIRGGNFQVASAG